MIFLLLAHKLISSHVTCLLLPSCVSDCFSDITFWMACHQFKLKMTKNDLSPPHVKLPLVLNFLHYCWQYHCPPCSSGSKLWGPRFCCKDHLPSFITLFSDHVTPLFKCHLPTVPNFSSWPSQACTSLPQPTPLILFLLSHLIILVLPVIPALLDTTCPSFHCHLSCCLLMRGAAFQTQITRSSPSSFKTLMKTYYFHTA